MTNYAQLSSALDAVGEVPCMSAPNYFFTDEDANWSDKMTATRNAKKLCQGCPIRLICLDYALTNDEMDGIWGGTTPSDRKGLRRGRN